MYIPCSLSLNCLSIADLELCPPEVVNQTVGVDNNVIFVTCRANQSRNTVSVSVQLMCECGFQSQLTTCQSSSTASLGLNIAYVRPMALINEEVTTYIENFSGRKGTVSFQCIVSRNDAMDEEDLAIEIFNFTVRYSKCNQLCNVCIH